MYSILISPGHFHFQTLNTPNKNSIFGFLDESLNSVKPGKLTVKFRKFIVARV